MSMPPSSSEPSLRLKQLLKEARLKHYRVDSTTRGIAFVGRMREWHFNARMNAEWLNVTTAFCAVPKEPGLRVRLLEWAMEANRTLSLLKLSVAQDVLLLEADYRAEHVDAEVLGRLVGYLFSAAEEQYPRAFRIVSGDERLEMLELSLQTGEAA